MAVCQLDSSWYSQEVNSFCGFKTSKILVDSKPLKRSREQFQKSITKEENVSPIALPPPKKQKIKEKSSPVVMGSPVNVRFGCVGDGPYLIKANVILTESFGILVCIKEEHPNLSDVKNYSKYWTRWKGEESNGIAIVDAIHQAL